LEFELQTVWRSSFSPSKDGAPGKFVWPHKTRIGMMMWILFVTGAESAQKVSSQPPLDEPVNLGNRNGSDQDYGDLNTKQGIINCYQLSSRNDSYNVVPPSDVNVS